MGTQSSKRSLAGTIGDKPLKLTHLSTIYKHFPLYRKDLAAQSYVSVCDSSTLDSVPTTELLIGQDGSVYLGPINDLGWCSGYGLLVTPNGSIYQGLFEHNEPNGLGTLVCPKGNIYSGEWKGKNLQDEGSIVYPSKGKTYTGQVIQNIPNGHGELVFQDGAKYIGEFLHGKKHGFGKYTWPDGSCYTGSFWKGSVHGHGVHVALSGKQYQGSWCMNQRHGHGRVDWPDGSYFEGNFIQGRFEGFGRLETASVSYCGFWTRSQYDGFGVEITSTGLRLGYWKSGNFDRESVELPADLRIQQFMQEHQLKSINKEKFQHVINDLTTPPPQFNTAASHVLPLAPILVRNSPRAKVLVAWTPADSGVYKGETDEEHQAHGVGVFLSTEEAYQGEFQHGWRHGCGRSVSITGETYVGEWQYGMKHGHGESWDAASRYNGEWKRGKYEGRGVYVGPEYMYMGQFYNNQFHGKGQIVFTDGRSFVGTFCHGEGELQSENGYIRSCVWRHGKLKRVRYCTQPRKFGYKGSRTWINCELDNLNAPN